MIRTGHIVRWNAGRGFGFIATPTGEQNIFFHVRDFRDGEPAVGLAVRFEQIEVGGKGPRAMAVQPLTRGPATTAPRAAHPERSVRTERTERTSRTRRGATPRALDGQPALFSLALLAWLGLLLIISLHRLWPVELPLVLLGLMAVNIATFIAYAVDKSAAAQNRWRTPESTLHALALAGGWPAAWLAQRALRHKSRKREFLAVYALTVLLHLGLLGGLLWHGL
ncbi:MAG: cold shock and DUF1294 domain-containing protein [Pseudomonadota bacterium]|nr:cold shock and DUF1294 domain-containing protein [Pseudomonadota bacterium]